MSNNDLWCKKCKSQHHPAVDCDEGITHHDSMAEKGSDIICKECGVKGGHDDDCPKIARECMPEKGYKCPRCGITQPDDWCGGCGIVISKVSSDEEIAVLKEANDKLREALKGYKSTQRIIDLEAEVSYLKAQVRAIPNPCYSQSEVDRVTEQQVKELEAEVKKIRTLYIQALYISASNSIGDLVIEVDHYKKALEEIVIGGSNCNFQEIAKKALAV